MTYNERKLLSKEPIDGNITKIQKSPIDFALGEAYISVFRQMETTNGRNSLLSAEDIDTCMHEALPPVTPFAISHSLRALFHVARSVLRGEVVGIAGGPHEGSTAVRDVAFERLCAIMRHPDVLLKLAILREGLTTTNMLAENLENVPLVD